MGEYMGNNNETKEICSWQYWLIGVVEESEKRKGGREISMFVSPSLPCSEEKLNERVIGLVIVIVVGMGMRTVIEQIRIWNEDWNRELEIESESFKGNLQSWSVEEY